MRIEVVIPEDRPRRWHLGVVEALAGRPGTTVGVVAIAEDPSPAGLDLLFRLERLIGRRAESLAVDPVAPDAFAAHPPLAGRADLVVDLTGAQPASDAAVRLRVTCGGLPPLAGAVTALLDGADPMLEAERGDAAGTRIVERWFVAVEERRRAIAAVSMILARLAHLVRRCVGDLADPERVATARPLPPPPAPRRGRSANTAALARETLGRRVLARLMRRLETPDDWRTIWRLRDPASPADRPERDPTAFAMVPDDGRRFYADPFPFRFGDRVHLFVEEFPHATGKGILSVAEVAGDGRPGPFRPFLETDCHLSYPQVFAAEGATLMIPETTGRRTVELWRAIEPPDRWELDTVLISGTELHDPTLVESDGRWFLYGTGREAGSSSWDALHVWTAPALRGPWTEIGPGPLRVDVASVRPAGRPFRTDDGGLMRPVQDSSRGYGSALAITRFDPARPGEETIERRIAPAAPWSGLHTWNRAAHRAGTFEVMDLFGPARPPGDPIRPFAADR
jgi:hypothetical protein